MSISFATSFEMHVSFNSVTEPRTCNSEVHAEQETTLEPPTVRRIPAPYVCCHIKKLNPGSVLFIQFSRLGVSYRPNMYMLVPS